MMLPVHTAGICFDVELTFALLSRAVISIECMPEACVLVKGKPRVRMVPEKAAAADVAEQAATAKEEALGSGTADPAADMFKSKVTTCRVSGVSQALKHLHHSP